MTADVSQEKSILPEESEEVLTRFNAVLALYEEYTPKTEEERELYALAAQDMDYRVTSS